jgi:hypothetical protein
LTEPEAPTRRSGAARWIPWLITIACFSYLYFRLSGAARAQGQALLPFLFQVFADVSWGRWLALMLPYSALYFLIDSAVVWRVVNWFNARISFQDVLPIRGSSFILSIVNEQIGKGAMGYYLNRRHAVPGWEVASSMLFIMFCEFFYLLAWATVGWFLSSEELPAVFAAIPVLAAFAALFLVLWIAFFRGGSALGAGLRERPILRAFRQARPHQYLTIMLMRSPALVLAAFVYAWCAQLFGVEVTPLSMLGYVPVVFFGAATPGPMRSVAITLWVVLFPGNEAQMAAFGFVQHNFFIFFNAAIGLMFLPRAQRELFGDEPDPA